MTPNQILERSLYGRPANPDFIDVTRVDSSQGVTSGRVYFFALVAFGLWLASVFLIMLVPAFFLIPYIVSLGTPLGDAEALTELARSDPTAIILQLLAVIPAHLITLALAWALITQWRRYSFRGTVGWQTGGFRWWHYFLTVAGFFAIVAVTSNFFPEQENDLTRMLRSSRTAVYVTAFMATFTAPIVEEVVYRGVVYTAFQRAAGVPLAFIFTTLLFALVHVPQYYPSVSTILLLTLLSVILTAVRVWTGNLLPCVVLHTLFNGIQSLLLVLEPLLKDAEMPEKTVSLILK